MSRPRAVDHFPPKDLTIIVLDLLSIELAQRSPLRIDTSNDLIDQPAVGDRVVADVLPWRPIGHLLLEDSTHPLWISGVLSSDRRVDVGESGLNWVI